VLNRPKISRFCNSVIFIKMQKNLYSKSVTLILVVGANGKLLFEPASTDVHEMIKMLVDTRQPFLRSTPFQTWCFAYLDRFSNQAEWHSNLDKCYDYSQFLNLLYLADSEVVLLGDKESSIMAMPFIDEIVLLKCKNEVEYSTCSLSTIIPEKLSKAFYLYEDFYQHRCQVLVFLRKNSQVGRQKESSRTQHLIPFSTG